MKLHHLLTLCLLTLVASTGCAPVVDQRDRAGAPTTQDTYIQPKNETDLLRDDIEVLRQHIDALEQAQSQQDLGTSDQSRTIAELRDAVAFLRTQIDEIKRKQDRQKQEIIDSISAKMADVMKKQGSSSRGSSKSSGSTSSYTGTAREHTVQSGETLSAIAQAYGSSIAAIKKANNMNSDMVRVGQKLVVPVKE